MKRRSDMGPAMEPMCIDCGFSHAPKRRQDALRRLLPMSKRDIADTHPCWWSIEKNAAGAMRLYRDLRTVGATRPRGAEDWSIP